MWGKKPVPANSDVNVWQNEPLIGELLLGNTTSALENGDSLNDATSKSKRICKFFFTNSCNAGDSCTFSHSLSDSNDSTPVWACEICCENVLSKKSKFGLMENCDHVFCLECIRSWRSQKLSQERLNLRKCPICRLDSFIVIPSSQFLQGREKLAEKVKYTSHLSQVPCKNFASGKCTFGTSCMYNHPETGPLERRPKTLESNYHISLDSRHTSYGSITLLEMSTDPCPREPSVSWSMRADNGGMGDSPGRTSGNGQQSNRTLNDSRGDSLVYSEDSQDQQNLLQSKGSSAFQSSLGKRTPTPKTVPAGNDVLKLAKHNRSSGLDSMTSEDSLQETSRRACCVIQ